MLAVIRLAPMLPAAEVAFLTGALALLAAQPPVVVAALEVPVRLPLSLELLEVLEVLAALRGHLFLTL